MANLWLDEVLNHLQKNQSKKIVLIGGASSAGKTYRCKRIKEYLEQNGKKCLLVSLDNFYRSLSLRMTDYAIEQNPTLKKRKADIYGLVSDTTRYAVFDEKFCDQNKQKILNGLNKHFDSATSKRILSDIMWFYQNVNFDVPEAIDFDNIAKQIKCKNGKISLPSYSFVTSEVIAEKEQQFDIKNFDYIIFEGIFALRPEILQKIDREKTLTISLEADNMTMFSRRMYRDIIKEKRTRSPQQTFESYFEQVLPCFDKYVKNSLENADLKIDAYLSDEEILKKSVSKKIENYDYKIVDKDCTNVKIYIQNKNNLPYKLILEYYAQNKTFQEVYDFTKLLNQKDIQKVLSYFKSCGFQIVSK